MAFMNNPISQPSFEISPSFSLWSRKKSVPYREVVTSSPHNPALYSSTNHLSTTDLYYLMFLPTLRSRVSSWFLLLPRCCLVSFPLNLMPNIFFVPLLLNLVSFGFFQLLLQFSPISPVVRSRPWILKSE
jgi:hypothetical protein